MTTDNPNLKWIRTCQECFNKQEGKEPPTKSNDRAYWKWAEAKCKKCRSEALDFGSLMDMNAKEDDNEY